MGKPRPGKRKPKKPAVMNVTSLYEAALDSGKGFKKDSHNHKFYDVLQRANRYELTDVCHAVERWSKEALDSIRSETPTDICWGEWQMPCADCGELILEGCLFLGGEDIKEELVKDERWKFITETDVFKDSASFYIAASFTLSHQTLQVCPFLTAVAVAPNGQDIQVQMLPQPDVLFDLEPMEFVDADGNDVEAEQDHLCMKALALLGLVRQGRFHLTTDIPGAYTVTSPALAKVRKKK